MRIAASLVVSVGLLFAASASRADATSVSVAAPPPAPSPPPTLAAPAPAPKPKDFPALVPATFSHRHQLGLAVMPGIGYRGIFPYQENVDCGQMGKRICTQRLPFFLDVQPSFGFAKHWDVLVDFRFGLEQDFTRSHEIAFAPGVRYWVDPDESAKFFATIQGVWDVTAQNDSHIHNNDFAVRNSNGFMFEVMRNFGAYVEFGETIGFVRWLRFEIDAGIGVQARLP